MAPSQERRTGLLSFTACSASAALEADGLLGLAGDLEVGCAAKGVDLRAQSQPMLRCTGAASATFSMGIAAPGGLPLPRVKPQQPQTHCWCKSRLPGF